MTQPPPAKPRPPSQRGLWIAAGILGAAVLVGGGVLVALTVGDDTQPASTAPAATPPPTGIGTPIEIKRADTAAPVGTITFSEVVALPDHCIESPQPGTQPVAVRSEIRNTGAEALTEPTSAEITTLDAAGITQPVADADIATACRATYPRGASAAAGRNTVHWSILQIQPSPTALQFTPIVLAADATIEDLEHAWVKVSPESVKVTLPTPLPVADPAPAPTAEPTTTVPVETTEPAVVPTTRAPAPTRASAPAAGIACDPSVDNWAIGADGGQLKCAYAGGPTPKWVNSAPLIGTRQPGSPCSYDDGVAESPSGQTLVCTGPRDSAVWTPGP